MNRYLESAGKASRTLKLCTCSWLALAICLAGLAQADETDASNCPTHPAPVAGSPVDAGALGESAAGELVVPAPREVAAALNLLPAESVVCLELTDVRQLVESIVAHPLREQVEQLDDVAATMRTHEFKQVNVVRRMLEYQLEMSWGEALETLTAKGLFVGLVPQDEQFVVVAQAADAASLSEATAKLLEMVEEIRKLGIPLPLDEVEYRGVAGHSVGPVSIAVVGEFLIVSNSADLAKQSIDRWLDSAEGEFSRPAGLAGNPTFVRSRELHGEEAALARAFIDLETIRQAGWAADLFAERLDNIGLELVVGGLQSNLANAPYAIVELAIKDHDLQLLARTPHSDRWVHAEREYFFGGRPSPAPAMLVPEEALLNVTTYRDLAGLWLAKEDLFGERHIAELAQADSQLSTFFSGLDFGEEILGAVKPGVQIVSAIQDFTDLPTPQPDIKLPSFAVVAQLAEPEKVQRRFKMAFQSTIGLVNLGLGQEGQPQLDMETQQVGEAKLVTTSYVAEDAQQGVGLINYNFSPTLCFIEDSMIISSTRDLAIKLVEAQQQGAVEVAPEINTALHLQGPELLRVLEANREVLIAQNMLEEGVGREQSEATITSFLSLIEVASDAQFQLARFEDFLELELIVRFKEAGQ